MIDVHAVFPNLKADATDEKSYRFARTDDYLKAIHATGAGIVYRLGESIEHSPRKHRVHPPADHNQWAAACVGIIRHYNEGWAGGMKLGIRYWEIWNEPENRPAMWTGNDDDYFRLYSTAALAIRKRFSDVKIGGPSVGATGEVVDGQWKPTPFLRGFFEHVGKTKAPLDFFSWHTYSNDPLLYGRKAKAMRRWLDEHGFRGAELHLNEWNYLPDDDWTPMLAKAGGAGRARWYERMGGAEGAAFAATVLLDLQDAPVDVCNFYSGDSSHFGLFTRDGVPKKTFHAMRAFVHLVETPVRVEATGQAGSCRVVAGLNKGRTLMTVLASRFVAPKKGEADGDSIEQTINIENLPWKGATRWQVSVIDAEKNLEAVDSGRAEAGHVQLSRKLSGQAVVMVRLSEEKR